MADDRQFGIAVRIFLAAMVGLGTLVVAGLFVPAYQGHLPMPLGAMLVVTFILFLFSIPLLILFIWVAMRFPDSISRHPIIWSIAGAAISTLFGSLMSPAPGLHTNGAVIALIVAGPAAICFSISMIFQRREPL